MKRIFGAGILLLALGCTVRRAEPSRSGLAGDAEAEIRSELFRYYADFSARDWNRFADHFWPGATITTVWRPPGAGGPVIDARTVPAFVANAPEGPGSKPIFEERMTQAELRIHRNLAQVWARYDVRFGDSAEVATWSGLDAFTLMKHAGRWRITSLAFTGLQDDPTEGPR